MPRKHKRKGPRGDEATRGMAYPPAGVPLAEWLRGNPPASSARRDPPPRKDGRKR